MTQTRIERSYIDGCFGQLHVHRAVPATLSDKTPVLCLHLTPLAAEVYNRFLGEMANKRLAIAVDTPGYGNSDPPPERPTVADYAAAFGDLLDALELERVAVMGFHTGSKLALELARRQRHRVTHIVMVSIAFWTARERATRQMSVSAPVIDATGDHLRALWREIERWSTPGRTPQDIAESFYTSQLRPEISHWGYAAAWPYDVEEAMAEVEADIPVLLLNPEDDLADQASRLRPYLRHPASRFVDLPGWGHGFLDLKTAQAATLVNRFLDGEDLPSAL